VSFCFDANRVSCLFGGTRSGIFEPSPERLSGGYIACTYLIGKDEELR